MFRALLVLLAAVSIGGCDAFSNDDPAARQMSEWRADSGEVTAAALKSAAKDPDVQRFYEARKWAAAWDGDRVGQLAPGYSADIALWDVSDIREIPYWYGDRRCMGTWVKGKPCYSREASDNLNLSR